MAQKYDKDTGLLFESEEEWIGVTIVAWIFAAIYTLIKWIFKRKKNV